MVWKYHLSISSCILETLEYTISERMMPLGLASNFIQPKKKIYCWHLVDIEPFELTERDSFSTISECSNTQPDK